MLTEWEKSVLKRNRINEEDVESVTPEMVVSFKDGSERRICEVQSRVMGYLRPSTEYNIGKYSEFRERKHFSEDKIGDTPDDAA